MKKTLPWLPLALFVTTSTANAHPSRRQPTNLDLRVRALMLKGGTADFSYERAGGNGSESDQNSTLLSKRDVKRLANSLYLLRQRTRTQESIGSKGNCLFLWYLSSPSNAKNNVVEKLHISFNTREQGGKCVLIYPGKNVTYTLHPTTVKRWMQLVLTNPRISPALRAQIKS